jgi:hypothetical protein
MRNLARSLVVLLFGAFAVLLGGLSASAQTGDCQRQETGYAASRVCSITVDKAVAVCAAGAVQLSYQVSVEPAGASTVDLRWGDPAVVLTGQPLAGTVAWPASAGTTAVDVQFVSGATATVRVNPAAAVEACTTSRVLAASDTSSTVVPPASHQPAGFFSSGVLASTGSDVLPLVLAGGGLLVAGAALVATRAIRNRRTAAQQ